MQDHSRTFARFHHQRWLNVNKMLTPHLIEFYHGTEPGRKKMPVLELGCGTGHIALSFLEKGFRVTGVEPSENMLALARENASRFVEGGQASLAHAELNRFEVAGPFGLVLAVHDDFNHFESLDEVSRCFSLARQATADGGYFIFDLYTSLGLQKLNNIIIEDNRQTMAVVRGIFDASRERLLVKFSGFLKAENGLYERFEELLVSHAFELERVAKALRESGWTDFKFTKYTDFSRALADPEKVSRVFVVARRTVS